MRVGLVVPLFNRPEYLRLSLQSISATRREHSLYLVNDASTDAEANNIFEAFTPPYPGYLKVLNPVNSNVFRCLSAGWEHFFDNDYDVLVNLDSDTLVEPHWLDTLLELHLRFPDAVVSGFNTRSHRVKAVEANHCLKDTIGGINMLFGRRLYPVIAPCLSVFEWDWRVCDAMRGLNRPFVVSRPSVVQHLGRQGLTSSLQAGMDVACDYGGFDIAQKRLNRMRRLS